MREMTIREFIREHDEKGDLADVRDFLDVSNATISKYKNGGILTPSLKIAILVYINYKVVLLPYSQKGIENAIRNTD